MKAVSIILIAALVCPVYAQQISEYQAVVNVEGTYTLLNTVGKMHERISITFLNNYNTPLDEVTYPFVGDITSLTVYDSNTGEELQHETKLKGEKTYVTTTLASPLAPGSYYTLIYDFIVPKQIRRSDNTLIMTNTQLILANVKKFELAITLPEGYVLAEEGVIPEPRSKISDGRRLILIWDLGDPIPSELRGEFKVIVLYERLGWYPNIYYLILFLILLLFAGLYYRSLRRRGRSITDIFDRAKGMREKIDILKEDEQNILKIVIENDGIDQREIQRKTDFSKTKVSKILSELEKRGTIRKEAYGRRNKIFLTKKIKET